MGYLQKVEKIEGGGSRYAVVTCGGHNALGQIGWVSYGNGAHTTYDYWDDGSFRLERIETVDKFSNEIQDLSYTFDEAGNVETISDSVNSVNHAFTYDEVNRLTQAVGSCSNPMPLT